MSAINEWGNVYNRKLELLYKKDGLISYRHISCKLKCLGGFTLYLENIKIENYGILKSIKFSLPFNENGTPKPLVFVGRNGSGKTLLLSNIVHSLIEFKRTNFNVIPEVDENKLYRMSSKSYIRAGETYSYINYRFSDSKSYTELMVTKYDDFVNQFNSEEHENVDIQNQALKDTGFFNNKIQPDKSVFDTDIFIYFPVDRYYKPAWLNSSNNKLEFIVNNSVLGTNYENIIKNNVLQNIENWILDIIIDMFLYEQQIIPGPTPYITFEGKNHEIHKRLNEILTRMFSLKNSNIISARIGIDAKENRKISIMAKFVDGIETTYVPSFSHLSSGEIMVFSIFVMILREYDRVRKNEIKNIEEVKGIIIIDEADLHLHSDFAKVILPELIKMFSGIQFIITSHSPFFLLGMKDTFNDNCEFISLPEGNIMNTIQNFEEIRKFYELAELGYIEAKNRLDVYTEKLKDIQKPLVITEGKTDWKHLKNALLKFQAQNIYVDLDLKFDEYEDELGDSKLDNLLKNLARKTNPNKIIGIFDNDEDMGKKYDTPEPVFLGNNVFGWCIPNVRDLPYGISVEFLYEETDIKTIDAEGRRIFLSSEFSELSFRLIEDNSIITTNKKVKECHRKHTVKIIDSDVFDKDDKSIALSKSDFATNVLNQTEPFNSIKIEGFRGVFERISHIINN